MRMTAHILLLLVLTVGVCPVRPGIAITSLVLDERNVRNGKTYEVSGPGNGQVIRIGEKELDLLVINLALSKSLSESRAANAELEDRVERLEEIVMDIAAGKI